MKIREFYVSMYLNKVLYFIKQYTVVIYVREIYYITRVSQYWVAKVSVGSLLYFAYRTVKMDRVG